MKGDKKLFWILWALCIVGAWLVQPYAKAIEVFPISASWGMRLLAATINAMLISGLACWASYRLLPKTDLRPFAWDHPQKRILYPGVIAGLCIGFVIFLLDKTAFSHSQIASMHAPAWTGLLASFYGGINEEVFLRLFLFTLIYFLLRKIFRFDARHRLKFLWITNIVVALLFGLGHLPVAPKLVAPSFFEISRILLLNGMAAIVLGWLYWTRGLWTAMAAHFVADLVIHVFVI